MNSPTSSNLLSETVFYRRNFTFLATRRNCDYVAEQKREITLYNTVEAGLEDVR
jgi:hypothetical protein